MTVAEVHEVFVGLDHVPSVRHVNVALPVVGDVVSGSGTELPGVAEGINPSHLFPLTVHDSVWLGHG